MEIIPAIDILNGRCVRLEMGDFDKKTDYSDPIDAAKWIVEAGARWLHVVDLDAARNTGDNRSLIDEIITSTRLNVEVGGGIRSLKIASELIEIGAKRLVLGTKAVEDPQFIADVVSLSETPVVVSLDYKYLDGQPIVQSRGWTQSTGLSLYDTLQECQAKGATFVLATDVSRDGMFSGLDIQTYLEVLDSCEMELIASGGVSSLADLIEASEVRSLRYKRAIHSCVIGKALHDGRVNLSEALGQWR